jgi:hypothetical protein
VLGGGPGERQEVQDPVWLRGAAHDVREQDPVGDDVREPEAPDDEEVGLLATESGVRFSVVFEGTITKDEHLLPPDELADLLDEVMEQMDTLEGVEDPDIDAALATGRVRFSVDVAGKPSDEAFVLGSRAIRTALHAAKIATPDWEDAERDHLIKRRRASLEDGEMSLRPQHDLVDA